MSINFSLLTQLLGNQNFTKEELSFIQLQLTDANIIEIAKGSRLFTQNQPCHFVYILITGVVRCFCDVNTNEVNLRFLGDYSFVAPFASLAQCFSQPNHTFSTVLSSEHIETVTPITALRLPLHIFLGNAHIPASLTLKLQLYICAQHYLSMEQRVKMLQHKKAIDRYRYFLQVLPASVIQAMPDYHIASYLGITPEALSRAKAQK